MTRRINSSQAKNMIRRAQQKQRAAIQKYNREVDEYNRKVKRAINDYNAAVRAHNTQVRTNGERLRRELERLARGLSQPQRSTYAVSVTSLHQSFLRLEEKANQGVWGQPGAEIVRFAERETANSAEALNVILGNGPEDGDVPEIQQSSLTSELLEISPELNRRWQGALYALHPRNPDAARHFCASAREILGGILREEAPDDEIGRLVPGFERTKDGKPTRRARIQFLLRRRRMQEADIQDFVETDLDDVVSLFDLFNRGAHGDSGTFDRTQLAALKRRVEDSIQFIHYLVRAPV
jgi:hypothetical protein